MKLLISSYVIFLFIFSFFSYLFIDPNLIYLHRFYSEFVFDQRLIAGIVYMIFLLIFFGYYIYFLKLIKQNRLSNKNLKLLIGLSAVILFLSYPAMLSFDIFNYVFSAKVLYFYHENPYIVMPIQFAGDPLLLFTHAANKVALYGPSWIGISSIPHILGFGNFLFTLFNFKLIAVLFYLLTIGILYRYSKDLSSIAFFALNPLVLIESLVSSHNDIAMMFFALSAFIFLSKKKTFLTTIFLTAAILIKYSTLFLIPIFTYGVYKNFKKEKINWKSMYKYCFVFMLIAFLLSPIREEIYPWYAIWFIAFLPLTAKNKTVEILIGIFSFSLLLRYVPFVILGTHADPTPLIKTFVTFVPVAIAFAYFFIKNKLWLKKVHLF